MQKNRFYNTFLLGEKILSGLNYSLTTRNFHDTRLLLNWKYIFGEYADKMYPCKIIFLGLDKNNLIKKTLYVSTNDRGFAMDFIFYKNILLEMINSYFGCEKSIFTDIKLKLLD